MKNSLKKYARYLMGEKVGEILSNGSVDWKKVDDFKGVNLATAKDLETHALHQILNSGAEYVPFESIPLFLRKKGFTVQSKRHFHDPVLY
ncbi:MAG: hypothetical protein V1847_01905 [Candidatus Diapherotrites archaeon]